MVSMRGPHGELCIIAREAWEPDRLRRPLPCLIFLRAKPVHIAREVFRAADKECALADGLQPLDGVLIETEDQQVIATFQSPFRLDGNCRQIQKSVRHRAAIFIRQQHLDVTPVHEPTNDPDHRSARRQPFPARLSWSAFPAAPPVPARHLRWPSQNRKGQKVSHPGQSAATQVIGIPR